MNSSTRWPTRVLFALGAALVLAGGPPAALARVTAALVPAARKEPPGSDVFVTPREALLREKPLRNGRILGKLPSGTRLKLLESGDLFLRVEVPGAGSGFLAREVAVIFPPEPESTCDLVVVGRTFGANESNRRLATMLLFRASERLRTAGTPDPGVDVLLGETTEALVAAAGPLPVGLEITPASGSPGSAPLYSGAAFRRALEAIGKEPAGKAAAAGGPCGLGMTLSGVRERAIAGVLRAQYPQTSATLHGLWQENAAWLSLVESAEDPSVIRAAADRLGNASLALARFLLATGKLEEIAKLEERVRGTGDRVQRLAVGGNDGKKLLSRVAILRAMRGDGSAPFPQEAHVKVGAKERVARIDGKLAALNLTVETRVGSTNDLQRRSAIPVLPVPGSLKISPDGKSVAWVEVAGPASLVPVITSLERDEPAREVAFLSSGRPMRDQSLAHVMSTVSGFSQDGQRLGLSIEAWNETRGPSPRLSVVSVATGELLFETSKDLRAYQRLLQ
ncbi:MAG TPA: SH3 domain-containing protein [Thermoanaerobaculia bacterium]